MMLTEHIFDRLNMLLPYLFSSPTGSVDSGPLHPLIFFLHGAGERGRDLGPIRRYGVPRYAGRVKAFPFFTVSPLCPQRSYWEDIDSVLFALLDDILARFPVDPRRVYLTGLSMGGHGTWVLGLQKPQRFAALAPVCAPSPVDSALIRRAGELKDKPVWVFHGGKDEQVSPEHSQRMVDLLRKAGAEVRYSLYPNARHNVWKRVYADPGLYDWFLSCQGAS